MPYIMYVAVQGDDKLARFSMDPDTGKLTLQEEIPVAGGPAPFVASLLLVEGGGSPWLITGYMAALSVLTIVALYFAPETHRARIDV